jgi:hypothetical protein
MAQHFMRVKGACVCVCGCAPVNDTQQAIGIPGGSDEFHIGFPVSGFLTFFLQETPPHLVTESH